MHSSGNADGLESGSSGAFRVILRAETLVQSPMRFALQTFLVDSYVWKRLKGTQNQFQDANKLVRASIRVRIKRLS